LSPTYFSTCGRLTIVRLTFFLMGKPVSLLAKRRISSTERKSSFASAGVIWWTFSTRSISRRCEGVLCGCAGGTDCGVGEACCEADGGGCGGVAAGVADGAAFCANPSDTNKSSVAGNHAIESFLIWISGKRRLRIHGNNKERHVLPMAAWNQRKTLKHGGKEEPEEELMISCVSPSASSVPLCFKRCS
jgi:hypothetical protein